MKQLSGSLTLDISRPKHSWNLFDVKITGPDVVVERRFSREVMRVLVTKLRETGILELGTVELTMDRTQVARAVEMAEAVMREELA